MISDAIDQVAGYKADWGAGQNRLEYTVSNLMNVVEFTSAARSRIQDADFAVEAARAVKSPNPPADRCSDACAGKRLPATRDLASSVSDSFTDLPPSESVNAFPLLFPFKNQSIKVTFSKKNFWS